MEAVPPRIRVAAYVIRLAAASPELLVFDHLDGRARRTTYVQLRLAGGPAGGWTHRVAGDGKDDGLRFACRFTPLPLATRLADHQDEFLDRIHP
ncbi:hypothetical protein [Micromonospora sp. SL4-19]|uniref:hypothetical protein n=1 Tax=Micromonospora sp. SL4-19 TaxID=3399129 RepID=UPI003A4E0E33